ncbi:MAG: hypothetical protein K0S86_5742 [Geminicoccaceae bacterium]|nr:hypothetical protein [Geminicoccaceae bacterium]
MPDDGGALGALERRVVLPVANAPLELLGETARFREAIAPCGSVHAMEFATQRRDGVRRRRLDSELTRQIFEHCDCPGARFAEALA